MFDEPNYRCFGCGKGVEELDELKPIPGKGNRSPRHFCNWCLGEIRA